METITYDAQGRIIIIKRHTYNTSTDFNELFTYTYAQNLITEYYKASNWGVVDATSETTYNVNAEGRIFKSTSANSMWEATYQDDNLQTLTLTYFNQGIPQNTEVTTYTYDTQTEVKGAYLSHIEDMFGSVKTNGVLTKYFEHSANKFVLSRISPQNSHYFTYEFDNEGYPIKIHWAISNESDRDIIISYN